VTNHRHSLLTLPDAPYRLVVDVWRAASASATLEECVDRLAALLAPWIEGDVLTVWRLARDGSEASGAATAALRAGARTLPIRRLLAPRGSEALQSLREFAKPVVRTSASGDWLARSFAPEGDWRSILLAPLQDGDRPIAVLALTRRSAEPFTPADLVLVEELVAPLVNAVRLEDERESEHRRLEALEADRRALLRRLDRDDLAGTIVGGDSGLREVMLRVEQVAPTDAPVLLLGETGSGKEVVARAIHARSRRAHGPVVRVNCGAIPAGLIDSELFGHEKGSFTGATATRKGWFERADGGTLFLDEIAELPLDAQVRLLRILQDGVYERVGAQRPSRVDVRVVAATHRNLRELVSRGAFREDLWYRLSVFPIEIPPVRARPEDIPALASHFAARVGTRLGGAPLVLSPADIDLLLSYAWPGNVRELAAVIERAAILGDGKRLKLGAALGNATAVAPPPGPAAGRADEREIVSLDEAMARHIERALQVTGGRIEGRGGAAALLRINPHTLRARMRKLGVDWAQIRESAMERRAGDGERD